MEDVKYLGTNAALALVSGFIGLLEIAEHGIITVPAMISMTGCIIVGIRDLVGAMVLKRETKK